MAIAWARGTWEAAAATWRGAWPYALLPGLTALLHVLEVNLVDEAAARAARALTGWSFGLLGRVEAPLAEALGRADPRLVPLVAVYYLAAFLAFLAWTPLLLAANGDGRLLRRALLCYPLAWLLALPWNLFVPSVNPYTRLGAPSPFDGVHPELEGLYYLLTTRDNTFPSLHVALTLVLAAALLRTRWRALRPVVIVHAGLLVLSVVALRVHHAADVLGGALVAWAAWRLAGACLAKRGRLSRVGRGLDALAARRQDRRSADAGGDAEGA